MKEILKVIWWNTIYLERMVWQQKEGEFPYNGKARLTPNFL